MRLLGFENRSFRAKTLVMLDETSWTSKYSLRASLRITTSSRSRELFSYQAVAIKGHRLFLVRALHCPDVLDACLHTIVLCPFSNSAGMRRRMSE